VVGEVEQRKMALMYNTNDNKLVRDDSEGNVGAYGPQHQIPITVRVKDHPITKDMPTHWMTTKDECYAKLQGPAENMTVLATGKDMSGKAPTDRHEPMLMVIYYGKGRVFHSTLGYDDYSIEGVGFIISFLRGVEWAAIPIPQDFPTENSPASRKFKN
jgi:type 1 glutamine amidotransferase